MMLSRRSVEKQMIGILFENHMLLQCKWTIHPLCWKDPTENKTKKPILSSGSKVTSHYWVQQKRTWMSSQNTGIASQCDSSAWLCSLMLMRKHGEMWNRFNLCFSSVSVLPCMWVRCVNPVVLSPLQLTHRCLPHQIPQTREARD